MTSDVFTKNLERLKFEKHVKVFFGEDKYMSSKNPERKVSENKDTSREYRKINGWIIKWSE